MRTSSHVRLKNTTEKIRSADRRSHKTNDRESRPPIAMKTEYEFTEVLRFSPRIRFSEPRRSAWSTICPFLMNKIVGMLRTAYCTAIALFESTSHLPIVTLPSYSPGQFVDDRSDHPAGAAPFGPEIDYQRLARIEQSLQIFGCDSKCHNFGIFKVYVSLWSYKGHNNIRQKHAATAKVINNLFNIPTGRRIHTYGSNSYISVYCNGSSLPETAPCRRSYRPSRSSNTNLLPHRLPDRTP